ncbi:MAG: hypothetical protein JF606_16085 [Burkholderiales bacterium]|nr:hypothetical protein [Burkholderiales bacterium]
MTISTNNRSLAQTIAAIESMDLSMIKFKATRKEDGYGWSAEYADKMEVAYKRYLILHAKYPEMTLAPEQDIDRFWHMHILDTRKYAADCEATFGHFLHHFPYLGLRGEADAEALQAAFLKMQHLYAQEFGEAMPSLQHDASRRAIKPRQAAFCSIEPSQASAAFCSIEPSQAAAAFCSIEPSQAAAAFCSIEPSQAAAFCSIEPSQAAAAFCSIEPSQAAAAFCSIEPSQAAAAFCSIEPSQAAAAFCSIEPSQAAAAFCSIEPSQASAAFFSVEPIARGRQ